MSVVLARIDDRLIHGQVSVGWAGHLHPRWLLVLDDEAAGDAWEGELICTACPEAARARVMSIEAGARALQAGEFDAEPTLVLVRSTASARRLAEAGWRPGEFNVGGLHHHPGSRSILPYVYLDDSEVQDLKALAALGVTLVAQDLPGNRRIDLMAVLAETTA